MTQGELVGGLGLRWLVEQLAPFLYLYVCLLGLPQGELVEVGWSAGALLVVMSQGELVQGRLGLGLWCLGHLPHGTLLRVLYCPL